MVSGHSFLKHLQSFQIVVDISVYVVGKVIHWWLYNHAVGDCYVTGYCFALGHVCHVNHV